MSSCDVPWFPSKNVNANEEGKNNNIFYKAVKFNNILFVFLQQKKNFSEHMLSENTVQGNVIAVRIQLL